MSYVSSLIDTLYTDNKHDHLNQDEKYTVCLSLLTVHRDCDDLLLCKQDADLWTLVLSIVAPQCSALCWSKPLEELGRERLAPLYTACHLRGHEASRRLYSTSDHHYFAPLSETEMKEALKTIWCASRLEHPATDNGCQAYYWFHILMTPSYTSAVKRMANEYREARCSHLCEKQASPLYRYQHTGFTDKVATFCSLKCRDSYVALLNEL